MLGLYIHIPFCRQKCFYCDFFSLQYDVFLIDKYIDVLTKHIEQFSGKRIHSIYIGGGTPSVLNLGQLQKLLQALEEAFDLHAIQEFTIELNPESVSKEKLQLLKNFGINRLSIGLQTVDDKSLRYLGRKHNFEIFCDAYQTARNVGFGNINIDLIYGLPDQTVKDWWKVLEKASSFKSEHLSLYPLTIEKNTPFYESGVVPDDDIQRTMYDVAVEFLGKKEYIHYEISNWAKRDMESFHNMNYWRNFEYLGIGAGACGYFKRERYKNVEDVESYIKSINDDLDVKVEKEYINDELYETERIMLGLRLLDEGIDISCLDNVKHRRALLECLEDKILEEQNNKIKLTKESVFVFNQIILKFIK
ncbi:MAG: radical SAM family heme chaperone HemW [Endomicrobium sp.]|jgi:oxygen-independent coproporphyrinogen-3 oxidase|nr:radical SAM family heme chaperone HemW [Endomicrobium sp.]